MSKRRVLLIGWDGADWEHITPLLDDGQLPTLEKLINRGTMGNLGTLQPVLSPMLWNSVATGKHAWRHGVLGFTEPDPNHGGSRPWSSYSRNCKALWNIFTQQGMRSNVINWWASHPAEPINGCVVTNLFNGVKRVGPDKFVAPKDAIHPAERSSVLAQFKVFEDELTGEQLVPFIPLADQIDQTEDTRLTTLAKVLCETMSTHNVATAVMENEPWDFMAVYYTGIDHFSHAFMQYHPPRMPQVPEQDFEIYKDVITGCYKFHDMMLERLLQLAGPDTTIVLCSDHGFQSRQLRPEMIPREPAGPAWWHRQYGIVVAAGPGIKQDERIYGASLIDIGPTILAMYDLPVGDDMDGRPLLELFEEPLEIKTIPSWDEEPGESGIHEQEQQLDPQEAAELLKQFIALGYIDDPGDDKEAQAESADIEAKYNLARNLVWTGQNEVALPYYEEIVRRAPWESRFIVQLAQCYFRCGYLTAAEHVLEKAFDLKSTVEISALMLHADILLKRQRRNQALAAYRQLETLNARNPGVWNQIGNGYMRMRRWNDAERVYTRATRLHGENAEAWQGLSTVHCRRGDNQKTIDTALEAVSLIHRLPRAHLNLGVALARSGQPDRALVALKTALKFAPDSINTHRWLSTVYRLDDRDPGAADAHRLLVRELQNGNSTGKQPEADSRRDVVFDLPEFASELERIDITREKRPDRRNPIKRSGKTFVIVSGLPRSGTSLMMQILEAGGLPAQTDGERNADSDNPRGYYEWEVIKSISKHPELLDDEGLERKAIKAVSMVLPQLPFNHEYKVLFMMRPTSEVAASQSKMIDRLGTEGATLAEQETAQRLEQHRLSTLAWMEHNPRVEYLAVDYPRLVNDPGSILPEIIEFVGADRLPTADAMADVVDASLYRQRKSVYG
ncbi:MAG: alkaline phosphatase family protein [Pirellulaceae bacterium]